MSQDTTSHMRLRMLKTYIYSSLLLHDWHNSPMICGRFLYIVALANTTSTAYEHTFQYCGNLLGSSLRLFSELCLELLPVVITSDWYVTASPPSKQPGRYVTAMRWSLPWSGTPRKTGGSGIERAHPPRELQSIPASENSIGLGCVSGWVSGSAPACSE